MKVLSTAQSAPDVARAAAVSFDVDELEQRVGGGFEPHKFCGGFKGRFQGRWVGEVHKREAQPAAFGQHAAEQSDRAAVEVVGGDNMVARFQKAQDGVGRGAAAGEGDAVLAVLQRCQRVLQGGARGVVRAAVLVALVVARGPACT